MNLREFVEEWNCEHKRFTFSVNYIEGIDKELPTNVEIRYPAAKYQSFYSTENWYRLLDIVDAKSHGTMVVVTSEDLFMKGIIEIKVASQNHNYQERLIWGVLRWIGSEFFPQDDVMQKNSDI